MADYELVEQEVVDVPYGVLTQTEVRTRSPIIGTVIDIAALQTHHVNSSGVYVAACRTDATLPWNGCIVLFGRSEEQDPLDAVDNVSVESDIGYATTVLADFSEPTWDRASSVQVMMLTGELGSRTDIEVLNGANLAMLGDEIIAYQDAELQEDGSYLLTNLLRGLRNSEDQTGSHVLNERFVPLTPANLSFIEFDLREVGATIWYKLVPPGFDQSLFRLQSFVPRGGPLLPFAPANVTAIVKDGGEIDLLWQRRTRNITRFFSGLPVPVEEDSELFEIDVIVDSAVYSTLSVSPSASAVRSTSPLDLETADVEELRIAQVSNRVGRGKVVSVTL